MSYRISGEATDVRITTTGLRVTNTLSLSGYRQADKFLADIIPVKTEDEIAEFLAWDGELLRLIQRYPAEPRKRLPRDQSISYVEPTIFPRYATHVAVAVDMALGAPNVFDVLTNASQPVVLGMERHYPEEKNTYIVKFTEDGGRTIEAITPGVQIAEDGSPVPLAGFENGFTRWFFSSQFIHDSKSSGGFAIQFEYKRHLINGQALFLYRYVSGRLKLVPDLSIQPVFLPAIEEGDLYVRDFSGRGELFDVTKNEVDISVEYNITNRSWAARDTAVVVQELAKIKEALQAKGMPQGLQSKKSKGKPQRWVGYTLTLFTITSFAFVIVAVLRRQKSP